MRRLFDILFPPREDEAILRDISTDDFLSLVAPRLVGVPRPGAVVLLPFSNPSVRAAVHEAKYHGNERAFRLLASSLAEYLKCADDDDRLTKSVIVVVPIPLGKARRKERGFNQSEEIARRALHSLGEEGAHLFTIEPQLLTRTRETVSQVSLPRRKREENMRGAFTATRKLRGAFGAAHAADPDTLYIVIDDVLTTGATLQAAVDALRAAGAERIIPLALAH
ncbi:MAG: ComF family protein [Minisyncoccota bacterium]